jgi:hypothetical protein
MRMRTLAALAALAVPAAAAAAQELPFAPGETCTYRGSNRLGRIGTGTLAVEAGARVNGRATYLLRFDFDGRVGLLGIRDRSRSWFDPGDVAAYRYTRSERSPLGRREQDVSMSTGSGRWSDRAGGGGTLGSARPLDELSFLYFVRTLPLADHETHALTRHFDPARNPVRIRVVGRGTTVVPAGRFHTVRVEMRVRDPERYGGYGVILLDLTDDRRRVPVRIESNVPDAGRLVLSLERGSGGCDATRLARAD